MKQYFCIFTLLIFFSACTHQEVSNQIIKETPVQDSVLVETFQNIINSKKLIGTILIFSPTNNAFYSNDFDWASKGQLPASTFKIPNSIIGLELGIIKDSSTVFPWNGKKHWNSNWEKDLKLRDAFQLSCVPCYQELARQIGISNMKKYLSVLDYGDMQFDSTNIDLFWLMGASKITPFQQIAFLQNFYERKIALKQNTYLTMLEILKREVSEDYVLYGKTGWSTDNDIDNTWFVGFLVKNNEVTYFASNLEATDSTDMNKMAENRVTITLNALESLNKSSIIKSY